MITRIFRVQIQADLRGEFEPLFQTNSVEAVKSAEGCLGLTVGRPTNWSPDEYVMVSEWESEQHLIDFVGPKWNEAHIPDGMQQFVRQCWVHHYQSF